MDRIRAASGSVPSVLPSGKSALFQARHGTLYYAAAVSQECNAGGVLEMLDRIHAVLERYIAGEARGGAPQSALSKACVQRLVEDAPM